MAGTFDSDLFPAQMFPDVKLGGVSLDKNKMTISINDSLLAKTGESASKWVMSRDENPQFIGEGDMIFSYKGAATLKWRNLHEKIWREGGRELLPRLAALDLVRRDPDSSMLLQFSNREEEEGFVLSILLEDVEDIEWTGSEYQDYDEYDDDDDDEDEDEDDDEEDEDEDDDDEDEDDRR